MNIGARGFKALVIVIGIIVVLAFLLALFLLALQLFLIILPIVLVLALLGYLWRWFSKGKKEIPKAKHIDVKYKVKE